MQEEKRIETCHRHISHVATITRPAILNRTHLENIHGSFVKETYTYGRYYESIHTIGMLNAVEISQLAYSIFKSSSTFWSLEVGFVLAKVV